MKVIGLTGGIGSGKSTVAELLRTHGYPVVDADQLAREVVEPGQPALAELAEAFGADILDEQGALRRSELAARAFQSEEQTALLNSITHPRIAELRRQRFAQAAASSPVVVYDMPLLVESGAHRDCDLVVVVHVEEAERVRRLVASRGLSEEDVRRRIAQQASDEERRAVADVVLDNSGTVADLESEVAKLIEKIEETFVV